MRRSWLVAVTLFAIVALACGGGAGSASTPGPGGASDAYSGADAYGPVRATLPASPVATPTVEVSRERSAGSEPTATVAGGTVEIRVVNFGFEPAEVAVAVGTTVVWRNDSPTTHTVTAKEGAFDSGLLQSGERFAVELTRPGVFAYWCTLHPEMVGTVIVR